MRNFKSRMIHRTQIILAADIVISNHGKIFRHLKSPCQQVVHKLFCNHVIMRT